jgi:hypothetical protein
MGAILGNIALVPASLLLHKPEKYQTIANNLPKGGVLICQTDKKQRISMSHSKGFCDTANKRS